MIARCNRFIIASAPNTSSFLFFSTNQPMSSLIDIIIIISALSWQAILRETFLFFLQIAVQYSIALFFVFCYKELSTLVSVNHQGPMAKGLAVSCSSRILHQFLNPGFRWCGSDSRNKKYMGICGS